MLNEFEKQIIKKVKMLRTQIQNFNVDVLPKINSEYGGEPPRSVSKKLSFLMTVLEYPHELKNKDLYDHSRNFLDWFNDALMSGCLKLGSNILFELKEERKKNKKLEQGKSNDKKIIQKMYRKIGGLEEKLKFYERDIPKDSEEGSLSNA